MLDPINSREEYLKVYLGWICCDVSSPGVRVRCMDYQSSLFPCVKAVDVIII